MLGRASVSSMARRSSNVLLISILPPPPTTETPPDLGNEHVSRTRLLGEDRRDMDRCLPRWNTEKRGSTYESCGRGSLSSNSSVTSLPTFSLYSFDAAVMAFLTIS